MGGPVKLIAPYFPNDYQVEHVSEVNIGYWTVTVSGAVANPITLSSQNMSTLQEVTVEAEFVPGDGKRTSNWTGLPIMDLLDAANKSYRAGKITVVAIDGYVKNYTFWEIEDSQMMLGYTENGEHFGQENGGPYRLFLPVDKYKWAQYWVKFVTQIIVS